VHDTSKVLCCVAVRSVHAGSQGHADCLIRAAQSSAMLTVVLNVMAVCRALGALVLL
jgi:hypothetical protein